MIEGGVELVRLSLRSQALPSPPCCVLELTPEVTEEERNHEALMKLCARSCSATLSSCGATAPHTWTTSHQANIEGEGVRTCDRLWGFVFIPLAQSAGSLHRDLPSFFLRERKPFFETSHAFCAASGSSQHHASRRDAPCAMLNRSPSLLLAITAVAALLQRCQGWSDEDLLLPPINSSNRFLANLEVDVRFSKRSVEESDASADASSLQTPSQCNVSVQRLLPTSLVARWDSSFGFQCDVLIYTTNNHGRAFYSASFNRAISPVVIEHLGVTGGQQEMRLCVGCGMSRFRRFGQARARGQQTGDQVTFCCVDFSLDELKGDKSWRLNRKPIESTLVACFMTLVIIVWSVAALIWPVPIIAGFLPNGMEQRRPRWLK